MTTRFTKVVESSKANELIGPCLGPTQVMTDGRPLNTRGI